MIEEPEILVHVKESNENKWMPGWTALRLYLFEKAEIRTHLGGFVRPIEYEPVVKSCIEKIEEIKANTPTEELLNIVKNRNAEIKQDYWEHRKEFDTMQQAIKEAAIRKMEFEGRAISYQEIIDVVQVMHPQWTAETITRRVRELVEKGELISPSKGRFYVMAKGEPE